MNKEPLIIKCNRMFSDKELEELRQKWNNHVATLEIVTDEEEKEREFAIAELEKIKAEIDEQIDFNESCCERTDLHEAIGIINRHIAELKGE